MPERSFPALTTAVAAPICAAALVWAKPSAARAIGATGSAAAAVFSSIAVAEVWSVARHADEWAPGLFAADRLNASVMVLYALLTLAVITIAPKRDSDGRFVTGALLLLSATLAAYAADNLAVFAAGWVISALPFIAGPFTTPGNWRPRAGLAGSCVAICMAVVAAGADASRSLEALRGHTPGGAPGFWLLLTAVILRTGLFPGHAWVEEASDPGPLLPASLRMNGYLGAFLMAHIVIPAFPHEIHDTLPAISCLALFSALYASIRAVTEVRARRLITLAALSQAACLIAGLCSGTPEGTTGALVHWFVIAAATTGAFSVLRAVEVRRSGLLTTTEYLGLAKHAPRLAVFFGICTLALVGLPGTLGFCSEDLLIQGSLRSQPLFGALLPIATAMNAFSLFRLFSRLFFGRERTGLHGLTDALPRERWTLSAIAAFLIVTGVAPSLIVSLRTSAADAINTQATVAARRP